MNDAIKKNIQDSIETKNLILKDEAVIKTIQEAAYLIVQALKRGGKILIFGNGGSAADSQHFAAELVGRFQKERKAMAALALTTDTSTLTALGNDYSFDIVFKRQVEALARPEDIIVAISTSGESKNVIEAVKSARSLKNKTISLTGHKGGALAKLTDLSLTVPSSNTARIQESHAMILHIISQLIEETLSAP